MNGKAWRGPADPLGEEEESCHVPSTMNPTAVSSRRGPRSGLCTGPEGRLADVGHLDPFRVGRGVGDVAVVPVPPFVRPALGVALRRVLPGLLPAERREIEIV